MPSLDAKNPRRRTKHPCGMCKSLRSSNIVFPAGSATQLLQPDRFKPELAALPSGAAKSWGGGGAVAAPGGFHGSEAARQAGVTARSDRRRGAGNAAADPLEPSMPALQQLLTKPRYES